MVKSPAILVQEASNLGLASERELLRVSVLALASLNSGEQPNLTGAYDQVFSKTPQLSPFTDAQMKSVLLLQLVQALTRLDPTLTRSSPVWNFDQAKVQYLRVFGQPGQETVRVFDTP
jgi:hypothetical protein